MDCGHVVAIDGMPLGWVGMNGYVPSGGSDEGKKGTHWWPPVPDPKGWILTGMLESTVVALGSRSVAVPSGGTMTASEPRK